MRQGDPYSTYRRRTLVILVFNAASWLSLTASAVYFALSPTCTSLAALLASSLLSALALYLFTNMALPDWGKR
jgi:hypothetical protein